MTTKRPESKVNMRRETDPAKFKPQGVVLNGKKLRDFKVLAPENVGAEAIYLRENEFTEFDPYIIMDRLKILDLSMNMISGTIDFMSKTPMLCHLYMTSNKIESLSGVAGLPNLETLCISDNLISSFEGLDALPNLRVLSMNYNQISSFHMFPHLPILHTLNLVGNPLAKIPSYRGMAIALCTNNLIWIDGSLVAEEERAEVEHHRGKAVFCMAEGFVIEGDNVEEAADKFLLDFQRKINESKPLQLQSIHLTSTEEESNLLTEGVPVKLDMCMQDLREYNERISEVFSSRHFFPVVFKISGDATEAFVVGSINSWTDPIPLERCEVDGEVFFSTTLYMPAGDYEYRYIVDGKERVSEEHTMLSKFKQGECNLYHVTEPEYQEGTDTDSLFYIRWMRSDTNNGFVLIHDENSLSYTPTAEDINVCLRAEVLVYVNGDFSFQYFDISTPVSAGPPRCTQLAILGDVSEGETLTVNAVYSGGQEGKSSLSWFRVTENGEEISIEMQDPWGGYELGQEDIGHRIKVEFTPIRNDWVAGTPSSVVTSLVTAGIPCCRSIQVVGDVMQDATLVAETVYIGGVEGESIYQWLRYDKASDDYFPIAGQTSPTFIATINDVGNMIAVAYIPISKDGIEGIESRCELDEEVAPAPPQICSMDINGGLEEGETLAVDFDYFGGYDGAHQVSWYRHDRNNRSRRDKIGSRPTHILTTKDIGCEVECIVIPIRSDGVQGEPRSAVTETPIRAGFPKLKTMEVVGEPAEGNILEVVADYFGGEQGKSLIEWSRATINSRDFEVVANKTKKYVIQREDLGHLLKLTYTPVRSDGEVGATQERLIEIPAPETEEATERQDEVADDDHIEDANEEGAVNGTVVSVVVEVTKEEDTVTGGEEDNKNETTHVDPTNMPGEL